MQKTNLTVIPILTFSNHFRKSIILVMTSRNSFRIHSMSSVTIDRCLCDRVKKSHTEKEIKVGLKLHCLSGYLMHLDDILQDSSAKGPLLYILTLSRGFSFQTASSKLDNLLFRLKQLKLLLNLQREIRNQSLYHVFWITDFSLWLYSEAKPFCLSVL